MHLVICYEIGKSPIERYQIYSYDESKLAENNIEPFPEVTHVIYDSQSGVETQLLVLSEYLKNLYPDKSLPKVPEDVHDDG